MQTLALTDEGMVFSWGDGDFGKLGRGGSEGCATPANVEKLNGMGIVQVEEKLTFLNFFYLII